MMPRRLNRLLFAVVLASCFLASGPDVASQKQDVFSYPDTQEGLRGMLTDLSKAIHDGDDALAERLSQQMVLVDHQSLLRQIFVEAEAEKLVEFYGKRKGDLAKYLRTQFPNKKSKGLPIFSIEKVFATSVPQGDRWLKPVMAALREPLPVYAASYQMEDSKDSHALGYYIYFSGAFRYFDTPILSLLNGAPPMRIRIGGNVQQAQLINSPRPTYPQEAKDRWIQGTVKLQVIVDWQGQVTDIEVLSGDPILVKAALDAVRQWRYRPTLLNGVPVEVFTTIDVVFTLSR